MNHILFILMQFGLLALGFLLLIKGADWFVDGAAGIADRLGVPQLVIGLTIVAMGTSAPEAAISISAALHDGAGIAVGNIVGSNILNILIILGITSLITPLAVRQSTVRVEIPFMVAVTAIFTALGLWGANPDGSLDRLDGVILTALFLCYLAYLFVIARRHGDENLPASQQEQHTPTSLPKLLLLLVCGMVIIVAGSNLTVNAATEIASFFGISQRIIGLTIVALGTSLPELVTCIMAAFKKNADIAIGNIIGSNIFNILFVGGVSSLITRIPYQADFRFDSLVSIGSALLLLLCIICSRRRRLGRLGGALLLAGYAAYFVMLV